LKEIKRDVEKLGELIEAISKMRERSIVVLEIKKGVKWPIKPLVEKRQKEQLRKTIKRQEKELNKMEKMMRKLEKEVTNEVVQRLNEEEIIASFIACLEEEQGSVRVEQQSEEGKELINGASQGVQRPENFKSDSVFVCVNASTKREEGKARYDALNEEKENTNEEKQKEEICEQVQAHYGSVKGESAAVNVMKGSWRALTSMWSWISGEDEVKTKAKARETLASEEINED
ncbi:hypothetical protein KI387_000532, partial [Taxus chinensis]